MLIKAKYLNARILKAEKTEVFFSISKKIAKLAVQRNKIKRMGRLAIRKYIANINNASIRFNFTSLPANQSEMDNDIYAIIKEIK